MNKYNYIVMAIFDDGSEESIGCEFKNKRKAYLFKSSFDDDWNRLDEFMPDSDYRGVKRLIVRQTRGKAVL